MLVVECLRTPMGFQNDRKFLAHLLLKSDLVDVGEWHAMNVRGNLDLVSHELQDVSIVVPVNPVSTHWESYIKPNTPWAEDHFHERVSGNPVNPPPSSEYWPYATGSNAGNDRHKKDGKFSHTYPERMWPRYANVGGKTAEGRQVCVPHIGLRFEYGDLGDLVEVLSKNLYTRQAYLPIWFPEDLAAAVQSERVPCTLGWHFMVRKDKHGQNMMTCNYYIRSCDFMRYFVDDLYMAGRLMQWLCVKLGGDVMPKELNMHIASLHAFVGDEAKLEEIASG